MTWNPNSPPTEQRWLGGKVLGLSPQIVGDTRGQLAELVRRSESPHEIAQVYAVWVAREEARANHYHLLKCEWIAVVHGECRLDLVDMASGQMDSLSLGPNADSMVVGIPPCILHTLTQQGDIAPAIVIACASTEYDPDAPDMFKAEQWGTQGENNV